MASTPSSSSPVDPDAIVASVEAANAAGIPVLAVDRTASGGMVTSLIASDNVAGGRMAGEALFEAMGGSGKVIEVQGDMAVASGGLAARASGRRSLPHRASPSPSRHRPTSTTRWPSQATQRRLEEDPDITRRLRQQPGHALGCHPGGR